MLADSLLDERQPGAEPTAGVVGRATRQGSRASIVDIRTVILALKAQPDGGVP